MTTETRKAHMPSLAGKAVFRPDSVNREERTVEVVFTTGEAGERYDYWNDTRFVESLEVTDGAVRTGRLEKGLSILDSHNRDGGIGQVMGVTEDFRFEDGKLIGTARFSANRQDIFDDVADGILRHVSLGYRIHEYAVSQRPGELESRVAVDWEPLELSLVPVSFETTNGTRSLDEKPRTFEVKLTTTRNEEDEMTDNVTEAVQEVPVAETRSVVDSHSTTDAVRVAADARKSLAPMLEAVRAAGLEDQMAIDAFSAGVALDAFRGQVLTALAETRKAEAVKSFAADPALKAEGLKDQGETTVRSIEEALAYRAGAGEMTDAARELSGYSMFEMARELMSRQGMSTSGMSKQKIADRAMHSTSDFPLILENVMNKNLLGSYNETPKTFESLGRRANVSDFREKHVYRMGDAPSLKPLNEHGEYEAGTLTESKESYAIDTFARKIAFTRKMLINDDMSAIDRTPRLFGASGARLENDLVWGLILNYDFLNNKSANHKMADGKALYHADHGNLLTGASSALSKESLAELRKMGRKQKTQDGHFMNVMFDTMVIPEDLEALAEDLMMPQIYAATLADQAPRHRLGIIIEPRLSVVSDTAWYAFSKMFDTFEYAYLSGEAEMYTEVNNSTDIDGLEIKVRKDFGCGLIEYRGMAKAVGA